MRSYSLIAIAALSSCSTQQPGVRVEYQSVNVPVAVKCMDVSKIPAPPAPITLTGNAQQDVGIVAVQAMRWRDVALDVIALAEGCR